LVGHGDPCRINHLLRISCFFGNAGRRQIGTLAFCSLRVSVRNTSSLWHITRGIHKTSRVQTPARQSHRRRSSADYSICTPLVRDDGDYRYGSCSFVLAYRGNIVTDRALTEYSGERKNMKGLKFAQKSITQLYRPVVWLRGFKERRRTPKFEKGAVPHPMPKTGLNLHIMSFNIRCGTARDGKNHWIFRSSRVHEILDYYRPDILGLQEALDFQVSAIRTMLPGYEMVGIGNLGGSRGLHNAIFYDSARFFLSAEGTFWFSNTPDIPGSKGWGNVIPRTCTWVRLIEKASQQAFYFYNVHLDHISLRSRKNSVVFLTRHIHARPFPDPFILAGDFNAVEKSSPIQYLQGNMPLKIKKRGNVVNPEPLVDTFRERYPHRRNVATFHGYRRVFFRFKLDYIFVPSSVRVHDANIIQVRWKKCYSSDHFPLYTRIHMGPM
jgi:endonuclease/exonuclease/phosphatase family metal-dependent hydrolase